MKTGGLHRLHQPHGPIFECNLTDAGFDVEYLTDAETDVEHLSSTNWETQWSTSINGALPLAAGRLGGSLGRLSKTLHSICCLALEEGRRFAV